MSKGPETPKTAVIQLDPEMRDWVNSQNLNRCGTLDRFASCQFLRDKYKMPITQSAVSRAIDRREIPATPIGNKLLVSEYDLVCFVLSRRNAKRGQQVSA